ncbi:MAG: hypothetical protein WA771_11460 [Chthoniobacterales bacterium]
MLDRPKHSPRLSPRESWRIDDDHVEAFTTARQSWKNLKDVVGEESVSSRRHQIVEFEILPPSI